jgi:hypothetical protein
LPLLVDGSQSMTTCESRCVIGVTRTVTLQFEDTLTRFDHQRAVSEFGRYWWLVFIGFLVAHAVAGSFFWFTPRVASSIPSAAISSEKGAAYIARVPTASWLYALPADTNETPLNSGLTLSENGHVLGPPHSRHAHIREVGGGSYSHWYHSIIFSSSDGSDPHTNGRIYSIESPTTVRLSLRILLLAVLALSNTVFFVLFRRKVSAFLRSWGSVLLRSIALMSTVMAALTAFGVFGTLIVAKSGAPKDAALAIQALKHACLGCLVSLGMWAAGAGVSRLVLRDPRAGLAHVLIPAFPVGLVLLGVLAVIAISIPKGREISFALWAAAVLPLFLWRPPREELWRGVKAAIGIIPFAIGFGIWLALLWHGPTETLSGAPTGDLTFYAGSIWSLDHHPFPNIDLGYENGDNRGYFNQLFPAVGAALLYLPGFDPFLFLLASGGTSYILLTTIMLHFYAADRGSGSPGTFAVVILVLSVLVAARYPYWVVESIPVIFTPALTIAVLWMAERGRTDSRWSAAAMVAALTGSILSKVATAAVLVPLGAAGVWKQFSMLPYAVRVVALGVACIFGIYSILMLQYFLPIFLTAAEVGPESLRAPQWYFECRDVAALALTLLAWRVADRPAALALTLGLSTFLLFSWVFQINFVVSSIVLGLMMFTDPVKSALARPLALAAFAASLPAVVLSDPGGLSTGFVWVACLGGASLVGIVSAIDLGRARPLLTFRATAAIALTTLSVGGLGLIGVARGYVIVDSGYHFQGSELTPELRDIWSAVRRLTPPDALIFTDQVNDTIDTLGGWNTYAFRGQRQIYLSSYYTALELRSDATKLRELLSINESVLAGTLKPADVPVRTYHEHVFAVISASRAAPLSWQNLYSNKSYAIFKIKP